MARTEKKTINGVDYTFQSVSPQWYFDHLDRCGMTSRSGNRETGRYMDGLFRNVVIYPAEIMNRGMDYFSDKEDIETPELLMREIENFLRPGKAARKASGSGTSEKA